ncbi:hypothetical protein BN1183_CJ_00860 [Pantoea ananatis]|nr:hypothetical protein BN1183_CJ_00860 [Pantoea ananatis]
MKETFTTSVAVSGKGDTKAKAFADALSRVQHEVLRNANKILLRIEPQDVKVVRARERVTTEKFLSFSWHASAGSSASTWRSPLT